jgi:hypothetical protein
VIETAEAGTTELQCRRNGLRVHALQEIQRLGKETISGLQSDVLLFGVREASQGMTAASLTPILRLSSATPNELSSEAQAKCAWEVSKSPTSILS